MLEFYDRRDGQCLILDTSDWFDNWPSIILSSKDILSSLLGKRFFKVLFLFSYIFRMKFRKKDSSEGIYHLSNTIDQVPFIKYRFSDTIYQISFIKYQLSNTIYQISFAVKFFLMNEWINQSINQVFIEWHICH